jgi:hypothetical protein
MNVIARPNGAGMAAPIANLASLPLMLLSGIFFRADYSASSSGSG